jgi:WD40 repeat protein
MAGLPLVPLRERVVEVVADFGTGAAVRYRYGSGFRLGGRLVLTAAHAVAGDTAAPEVFVRGLDKVPHPVRLVDMLAGDPGTADLALLELGDGVPELPPLAVAGIARDIPVPVPVDGCWAVGYPQFQEVKSASGVVRETAQVWGMILPAENLVGGLLTLQVTSAPRALPPQHEALGKSQWSGMSGAAVLAGDRLIGVVSEYAPRRGESAITVTPLTGLSQLPEASAARWWEYLATDPEDLVMLPVREERDQPAYRETMREVRARTGVLQGRAEQLQAIRSFAAGQASALAPAGQQYAWLVGGPWAGKTALLAEAVHTLPSQVDCVAYFLTGPGGDADRQRFLLAVVPQLAWLLGKEAPAPDEHAFRQLWAQAAQRAADTGRHLLLVVDGLDEDLRPGGHSVAGWLPGSATSSLPARVLAASRPYPRLPDDVDLAHPLAAFTPDKQYMLADSPYAARLRELAGQEITRLLSRAEHAGDLAIDVLDLLTAARGGPLAVSDLAALCGDVPPWRVRNALAGQAARTLQPVGPADTPRYTFAHETLLARCQEQGVGGPGHARRIHEWAAGWQRRGWPTSREGGPDTPLFLLDRYPRMLDSDQPRLTSLVSDANWVSAATQKLGVDAVLAELRTAGTAPGGSRLAAAYAVVRQQAHHLRGREAAADPGFVPRQLCLQAAQLGETLLAADYQARQLACDAPGPVLQWTTQQTSPAMILELRPQGSGRTAVTALPDGRVVTGGGRGDWRVLVWDPAHPGTDPVEIGRHESGDTRSDDVLVAVLPDSRVVTGSRQDGGRLLVWDPARPGTGPLELGRHETGVYAMAVLPDGRVVTGDEDKRVLVWDPGHPGTEPLELGRHKSAVPALDVLPDGRVVTGGGFGDWRVLVWDPAKPGAEPVELGRHKPKAERSIAGITAVAALPDGRVVTGGGLGDARVLLWDPAKPGAEPVELGRHESEIMPVGVVEAAALPDGRLVTGGGGEGQVLLWDPAQPGAEPVELGRHEPRSEAGTAVVGVTVLPGGQVVTNGYHDGQVLIWDPTMARHRPVESARHGALVNAMAVLPDGRLVTGSDFRDERVQVWDPDRPGAQPVELGRHETGVYAMAVLPDGRVVTIGSVVYFFRRVHVWDPAKPRTEPLAPDGGPAGVMVPAALAVLPDGRMVAGGAGVLVWDPANPAASRIRLDSDKLGEAGSGAFAVAVLPDGRVAIGSESRDGRMLLWDAAEPGAAPLELGRHESGVSAVAALPDGGVISGGRDGRVLLWDPAKPGAARLELGRHEGRITALTVLPDGRVVTGGADRRVVLRPVRGTSPAISLACSVTLLASSSSPSADRLFIGQLGEGISCWEIGRAQPPAGLSDRL